MLIVNAKKFWYFRNVDKVVGTHEVTLRTLDALSYPNLKLSMHKLLRYSKPEQLSFLQNQIYQTFKTYKYIKHLNLTN